MTPQETVLYNAKKIRREKKLNNEDLAKNAEVTASNINYLFNTNRNLNLSSVDTLAKGLEVDVWELFERP